MLVQQTLYVNPRDRIYVYKSCPHHSHPTASLPLPAQIAQCSLQSTQAFHQINPAHPHPTQTPPHQQLWSKPAIATTTPSSSSTQPSRSAPHQHPAHHPKKTPTRVSHPESAADWHDSFAALDVRSARGEGSCGRRSLRRLVRQGIGRSTETPMLL